VSGFPPFDPVTSKVLEHAPIELQIERVLEQLKLCVETAGSSLDRVLKCNVYCTSVEKFAAVNTVYARYFPKESAGPHFRECSGLARPVRHRDRLHRHALTRPGALACHGSWPKA
jgi:enamine deaminase RidA (YjgF/YER057c/UK114 family)